MLCVKTRQVCGLNSSHSFSVSIIDLLSFSFKFRLVVVCVVQSTQDGCEALSFGAQGDAS